MMGLGLLAFWKGLSAASKLTAIGSVGGALIDNAQRNKDAYANSPQGIREAAEKAGFNPLALLPMAGNFGAGYAPVMGSRIAEGFAAAADQNQYEDQLSVQKARLEMDNRELNERLRQMRFDAGAGTPSLFETVIPDQFGAKPATEIEVTELPTSGGDNDFAQDAVRTVLSEPMVGLSYRENGDIVSDMVESPVHTYVSREGNSYEVPKGPEWDELASGWLLDLRGRAEDQKRRDGAQEQSWFRYLFMPRVRELTEQERKSNPAFTFTMGPTSDPWVTFPNY
jgi:hypothetical protein